MKTQTTTTKKPVSTIAQELLKKQAPAEQAETNKAVAQVKTQKTWKILNPATAGKHLRAYWIASMQVAGVWNGAEKPAHSFHWALQSKTAFTYHKGKGNIVEGSKGGYKLVQKGKAALPKTTTQDLIDGYKAFMSTGKFPEGFKPATQAGAPIATKQVSIPA